MGLAAVIDDDEYDGAQPQDWRDGRHAPLTLRWETRGFWPALEGVFPGMTEEEAAVAMAVVDDWERGEIGTAYSRNRNGYPKREKPSRLHTYRRVVPAVDGLDVRKLVEHDRKAPSPHGTGRQSAIRPTPELIAGVRKAIAMVGRPVPAIPPYVLLRRDQDGNEMSVPDTKRTREMTAFLHEMNAALAATRIEYWRGALSGVLRRIFNRHMNRGGRFYAIGLVWQRMPPEERATITLNGEATGELDYKNLHVRLLYRDACYRVPPGDLYELPGWPRDVVKVAFLVLLNAEDAEQAAFSIARKKAMGLMAELGSAEAMTLARKLIVDIKAAHKPIASAFHSDCGGYLMRKDSDIAERVMRAMLKLGETVLPLHDGFIVRLAALELLREVMEKVAFDVGLHGIPIERKIPDKPIPTPENKGSETTSEVRVLTYPLPSPSLLFSLSSQDSQDGTLVAAGVSGGGAYASEASRSHEAEGRPEALNPSISPSQARTIPATATDLQDVQEAPPTATASIIHLRDLSRTRLDPFSALEDDHRLHDKPQTFETLHDDPDASHERFILVSWGDRRGVARIPLRTPTIRIRNPQEPAMTTVATEASALGHRLEIAILEHDPRGGDRPISLVKCWQPSASGPWLLHCTSKDGTPRESRYKAADRQAAIVRAFSFLLEPHWRKRLRSVSVTYDGPFDPAMSEAQNRRVHSVPATYLLATPEVLTPPDTPLPVGTYACPTDLGRGWRVLLATPDGSIRMDAWTPLSAAEIARIAEDGAPAVLRDLPTLVRVVDRCGERRFEITGKLVKGLADGLFRLASEPPVEHWRGIYDAATTLDENAEQRRAA
ncbi:hypothetical protein GCM10011390_02660 [Aureimonas endophytica]|uniref:Uncharacterized protein n=1 Tax=Aureimonas endophytica TaxID=2027858 RepID=A0A916ZD55_9HYPH|nr:hypothetical protein [Aureimonas endophytica]GGD87406.1 hypothetical protein GCM10011390_02660 [Aureimonas endophytica]